MIILRGRREMKREWENFVVLSWITPKSQKAANEMRCEHKNYDHPVICNRAEPQTRIYKQHINEAPLELSTSLVCFEAVRHNLIGAHSPLQITVNIITILHDRSGRLRIQDDYTSRTPLELLTNGCASQTASPDEVPWTVFSWLRCSKLKYECPALSTGMIHQW